MLSLREISELMNMDEDARLFVEAYPISTDICVVRISDQENTTVAYHKIDDS